MCLAAGLAFDFLVRFSTWTAGGQECVLRLITGNNGRNL